MLKIFILFFFLSASAFLDRIQIQVQLWMITSPIEMESEHFPGMATVIVKNGEIVWLQCYGFADIENEIQVTDSTRVFIGIHV